MTAASVLTTISGEICRMTGWLSDSGRWHSSSGRPSRLGVEPSRPSTYHEHHQLYAFQEITLDSLRTARAAILYFVLMVSQRENRKTAEKSGLVGALVVQSHEWIRAEED